MWYVIQTLGGEEEKLANMIRKSVPSSCIEECFIPKRERMKKFHGCWNKVEEVLFHGYVFVISQQPGKLYEELKRMPGVVRLLGRDEEFFLPLNSEEEKFIRAIGNNLHQTAISRVTIGEGKKIHILHGPLKNYERNIVRVNLHKREAAVRVEFMGRILELYMGIEMESKEGLC